MADAEAEFREPFKNSLTMSLASSESLTKSLIPSAVAMTSGAVTGINTRSADGRAVQKGPKRTDNGRAEGAEAKAIFAQTD